MEELIYLVKNAAQLHCELDKALEDCARGTADEAIGLINQFEASPTLLDVRLQTYIDKLIWFYSDTRLERYRNPNEVKSDSQESKTENPVSADKLVNNVGLIAYTLAKVRGTETVMSYFPTDIYTIDPLLKVLEDGRGENETYFVLMWLCGLVLSPFPFNSEVLLRFGTIAQKLLDSSISKSKCQVCALLLMSRILTRSDSVETGLLEKFILHLGDSWSISQRKLGNLMVLNKLLKTPEADKYLVNIHEICQYEVIELNISSVVLKILLKLGCKFAGINEFEAVLDVFNGLMRLMRQELDTQKRYTLAKGLSRLCGLLMHVTNYFDQLVVYIIQQLNIQVSAEFNESLSLLTNLTTHTILLFLGYMILDQQLPEKYYPLVMSIVHQTIFSRARGVGTQLRDSSCFILWASARAISPQTIRSDMYSRMLVDVIEVACLDENLVVRRCGVAVLQEFLGRFGRQLIHNENSDLKEEQILKLVELFAPSSVSTFSSSIGLCRLLLSMGFQKGILVNMVVRKIVVSELSYQKVLSSLLCDILNTLDGESILDVGVSETVPSIELILKAYKPLEHRLYLASELRLKTTSQTDFHSLPVFHELAEEILQKYQSCGQLTRSELAEDIIQYVMSCGCKNQELLVQTFQFSHITEKLIQLFTLMSGSNVSLDIFDRIISQLSLPVASSIFYFHGLERHQVEKLLEFAHNVQVDPDIRTSLIQGFSTNYNKLSVSGNLARDLVVLLNDYTVTEQGDVGSKIRDAVLDFIMGNREIVDEDITEWLIRILGEPIAKLRLKAFSILTDTDSFAIKHEINYYPALFEYYHTKVKENHRRLFWRGLVLSIGGLTGDSDNIRYSFRLFIKYMESLDDTYEVFTHMCYLITKKPVETQKILKEYLQALNVLIKIFEANLKVPVTVLQPMYVKAYNLQINCTNLRRISLSLELMYWLAKLEDPKVARASRDRIHKMGEHKSDAIKRVVRQLEYRFALEADEFD